MSDLCLTAIMKTDLRGSTPLFYAMAEDQLRKFLDEQKALISKLVAQHQGRIVKGEGDAFWVTFPSVTIAVQTAIQIQQEMVTRQVGVLNENRIALRIVISAGDVLHLDNDIFGPVVNLTARLETITPANEIYLSQAAWLALNQAEIATDLVGEFSLKGIELPEKVYKIVQSQRTIIFLDQIIVTSDLRDFLSYLQSSTTSDIENLLVNLETTVRAVCEENGGTIRVSSGDMFIFTFSEVHQALDAVEILCQRWDTFTAAHSIPCALAVGMHYGQLAVFRLFAYGEDIFVAALMADSLNKIRKGTTTSCVAISGMIQDRVLGTKWESQMHPMDVDKLHPRLRTDGHHVYEWIRD
jgi:class 3 adenylate cyclase